MGSLNFMYFIPFLRKNTLLKYNFFLVKGKWFIWSEEKPEYYWGMTDIKKSAYIVYNLMYLWIKIHPWNCHHNQCHKHVHHQTAPNDTSWSALDTYSRRDSDRCPREWSQLKIIFWNISLSIAGVTGKTNDSRMWCWK